MKTYKTRLLLEFSGKKKVYAFHLLKEVVRIIRTTYNNHAKYFDINTIFKNNYFYSFTQIFRKMQIDNHKTSIEISEHYGSNKTKFKFWWDLIAWYARAVRV